MTFVCKYCKSILSSEVSLKTHQKSTKKCLSLQGILKSEVINIIDEFKCKICNSKFTSKHNLSTHHKRCEESYLGMLNIEKLKTDIINLKEKIIKIEYENKILLEDKEKKILKLQNNNKSSSEDKEKKIIDLEKKIIEIETRYNMLSEEKKDWICTMDKITTSALSKTTINSNICNNINVFSRTDEEIQDIYNNNLTAIHIEGGVAAISKLIVEKIITDSNGNKMIVITDKSRSNAKYKLPSGEIIIDNGFNTFTTKNRDMIMKKVYKLANEPGNVEKILDIDTRLGQGFNQITDDADGVELKRYMVKIIG